jgi:predicted kinase
MKVVIESFKPTLWLIRGLPGSGKSTLASNINALHFEADQYFIHPQTEAYEFDASKLTLAHIWCQTEANTALAKKKNVVVSNTFTTIEEMRPYIEMSRKHDAELHILECRRSFGSIHNVPHAVIEKMSKRWEHLD